MSTAVIVGAGSGLGYAMARRFGREGYRIALVSRDPGRHADVLRDLGALGVTAEAFAADVRDTEAMDRALDFVVERLGEIDLVYYGPAPHGISGEPIDKITGADIEETMALVRPAADVVRKVMPSMRERGTGVFLFTSAVTALVPVPELGALTVAAAASRNYAVTLNAALAPHGLYAGVLLIGGLIADSAIHRATPSAAPSSLLDPDRVADAAWDLAARRRSAEALVMPGRQALALTPLLINRLLRTRRHNARPHR
ncbi:SDR family NAD(P)-dependent oxidoreductase [Actinocorallia sp. A-T 12471]|uniref:SDR family NAD(P)-dependent oxidoreductase n=1 Tax=Actinocorallia sp. A-T 12471 TaxID=3089813 RepID=UPI0029CCF59A|nr:SDR family NAD(P)-dependent oxidoreductase [Actinocorallia sp. A-T 12471]MDX6740581.1 SDR family NAD(P)-dependent oxidoreductase [Actinocorallia sp. A-T 12471]